MLSSWIHGLILLIIISLVPFLPLIILEKYFLTRRKFVTENDDRFRNSLFLFENRYRFEHSIYRSFCPLTTWCAWWIVKRNTRMTFTVMMTMKMIARNEREGKNVFEIEQQLNIKKYSCRRYWYYTKIWYKSTIQHIFDVCQSNWLMASCNKQLSK